MHIVSMNWVLTQVHSVDILWELAGCHPYLPVLFCFAVDKGHHVPPPQWIKLWRFQGAVLTNFRSGRLAALSLVWTGSPSPTTLIN